MLWNRIKRMTPQRARDVTRIISTATVNLVAMLQSNDGAALRVSQQVMFLIWNKNHDGFVR